MPEEFWDTPNGPFFVAGSCYHALLDEDDSFQLELCALFDTLDGALSACPERLEDLAVSDPDESPVRDWWVYWIERASAEDLVRWKDAWAAERRRWCARRAIEAFADRWHLPNGKNALVPGAHATLWAYKSWRNYGRVLTPMLGGGEWVPSIQAERATVSLSLSVEWSPRGFRKDLDAALADLRVAALSTGDRFDADYRAQWRSSVAQSANAFHEVAAAAGPAPAQDGPGKWGSARIAEAATWFFRHYHPVHPETIATLAKGAAGRDRERHVDREIQRFRGLLQPRGIAPANAVKRPADG